MSKFIIEYVEGHKEKTEESLKGSKHRLKMLLNLYFKVNYKDIGNNQFEFYFEPRAMLQTLMKVGGENVQTQMMGVALQGMSKLNDKFKEDGIKARVIEIL